MCSLFFRDSLWKAIPNQEIWQQMNTFAWGKYNIPEGWRKQFHRHLKWIVCITSTIVNVNRNTKDQRFQCAVLCIATELPPSSWMTINLFWSQVLFPELSSQKLHWVKDYLKAELSSEGFKASFPKRGAKWEIFFRLVC